MPNGNLYKIKQLEPNGLTACDLFCGAGVGAYGFKNAGFNILFGVDNDPDAVKTYNLNIGDHAICEDIRNLNKDKIPEHDLMVATPVCKPFSVAGKRELTNNEKYGDLLTETLRLFEECRPKALFFENVAGIVMGESLLIFNDFIAQIEGWGYHTYWKVVNSWNLGVPQERERVYMVAIRDDIPYEFHIPKEMLFGKKTQRDAFWDLRDKDITTVKNHNIDFVYPSYDSYQMSRRQRGWDEPGVTVLSTDASCSLYPEPVYDGTNQPRRLSIREQLRLQTVGDDFYFPDDIPIVEQYNRCSGVPSLVSYKYGIAIADCLLGRTEKRQLTIKKKKLF